MVFNWFRRRFDETPQVPQNETDSPEPEQAQVQPEAEEQSQDAADYLSWAKAAYQNIQQRQTESVATIAVALESTPSEATGLELPTPDSKAAPDIPDTAETTIAQTATSAVLETAASLETETAAKTPALESITTEVTDDVSTTPEIEAATASAPAPLSFLARAEAERQARLERLKATAIEEPEPETSSVTVAAALEPVPIAFDEGFLWSAEILAAQGRRVNEVSLEEITWLKRLRQGLDKTRRSLINQLKAIVGQGPLNQDAVMEIEALLLQADVGVEATDRIIDALQNKLRQEVLPPEAAIAYLKQIMRNILDNPLECAPSFAPEKDTLNIWLLTGVNGAGKTTTLGKIAYIAKESGYRCLIAAADTFRAAAVEQVKIWGQRSGIEAIANLGANTDPAAVVFDAIVAAQARGVDLLLVDTAGRLQNKKNLMDELSKIRRTIAKKAPDAKVESLLVLDATLGQNGLRQAQVFSEAVQLTGVILTKLDGTAKGGVALAVVQQLGLPIRFIGAGEGIQDLRPFSSYEFVEALLSG